MATGLGFFDAEGVWQFGELDTDSLASDLLNRGMESVSDQFAVDRARLTVNEGNITSLGNRATALETRARALFTMSKTIATATIAVLGGTSPDYAWTESDDTEGWHHPSTNPTRIKPTTAGRYLINYTLLWAVNSSGYRFGKLKLNGTDIPGKLIAATNPTNIGEGSLCTIVDLNGTTDYIEVSSYQNSGSSLLCTATLDVMYIGNVS